MLKKTLKKALPGISWQNPIVRLGLTIVDPVDYLLRAVHGLQRLPKYSVRVRSNGINQQLGGGNFERYGKLLARILQEETEFTGDSDILEIGCGCGRTAFGLIPLLDNGKYTGMDIDPVSLGACQNNTILIAKGFCFDLLDIYNFEYNPTGIFKADTFNFPYESNCYDVVFLVSVFTHMLKNDVSRYIQEISRILKPGGYCMMTTFLMDYGKSFESSEVSFMFSDGISHYRNQVIPEMAVGYYLEFFRAEFARNGMAQSSIFMGEWRNIPQVKSTSFFPQDILFFKNNV